MNCYSNHKLHCSHCGCGFDDQWSLDMHKWSFKHQGIADKPVTECEYNEIAQLDYEIELEKVVVP